MKTLLIALGLVTMFAISCKKDLSTKNGSINGPATKLTVFLTDDQSLVFDKVMIDIQRLEIKVEDDGVDSLGGWFSLNIKPGVYDILQLRNGIDTLFATGAVPAGRELQKLRLTLGNNNSVVQNGQTFPLALKNNNNQVIIKLENADVDFDSNDHFSFTLDFDAGRSIRFQHNQFELDSQLRPFAKKNSGSIEGRVVPASAQAVVMAINGSDTATAKPSNEGEFKIVGLKPGTYQMIFHATANNYLDSTVGNVIVQGGEDTQVGTVTLKQ